MLATARADRNCLEREGRRLRLLGLPVDTSLGRLGWVSWRSAGEEPECFQAVTAKLWARMTRAAKEGHRAGQTAKASADCRGAQRTTQP